MAKTKKKNKYPVKPELVKIKKLRTNYEVRFEFSKFMVAFIKTFPAEHRSFKINNVYDLNTGAHVDDPVWIIREVEMGKFVIFLMDNNIKFVFENITRPEIDRLRQEYKNRQNRIKNSLKAKSDMLEGSENEFYDFLKIQPYPYQKQAVKFSEINEGKFILGDQPGVGKTLVPIAYATKNKLKTLVICPSSLKLNWRKEILKFSHEKAHVFKYKPTKKSKKVNYSKEESLFHIINYESIETYIKLEFKHTCKNEVPQPGGMNKVCNTEIEGIEKKIKICPTCNGENTMKKRVKGILYFEDKDGIVLDPDDYDLIAIDECHRIKESKTSWTKIIRMAFRDVVEKKILMSGTAIKSRPMEMHTLLNFLYPEEWNSMHHFGTRYCAGFQSNFGWDYDGASNLDELFERVSPYFLRRLKKDVLKDLPPKTYTNIPIELTPTEMSEYKRYVKESVDNEEGFLEKIHKIKSCTGRAKVKRAIEMVEDIIAGGEKVVIMSDYQELAESLHKHFGDTSVIHTGLMDDTDKQDSVDRFQEDENVKVFCGMIGASGVGITLTEASRLVFVGFAWTPADMEQAEDRIHRATTEHDNIEIITLICEDTIDVDIDELLREKSKVVNKVLDNTDIKKNINVSSESIYKELAERLK